MSQPFKCAKDARTIISDKVMISREALVLTLQAVHMNIGFFWLIKLKFRPCYLAVNSKRTSQLLQHWTIISHVTTMFDVLVHITTKDKEARNTLRICLNSSRGPPFELRWLLEEHWWAFNARGGRLASWTVRVNRADRELIKDGGAQCVRGATQNPTRGYLWEIRVGDAETAWGKLLGNHLTCTL